MFSIFSESSIFRDQWILLRVHDIAVPGVQWNAAVQRTCSMRRASARVPSTFYLPDKRVVPNEATAAQLTTCVTWFSRGSFRKVPGWLRSPMRIFSTLREAVSSSENVELTHVLLHRACARFADRRRGQAKGVSRIDRSSEFFSSTAPPRKPVTPVINNIFIHTAVSLWLMRIVARKSKRHLNNKSPKQAAS